MRGRPEKTRHLVNPQTLAALCCGMTAAAIDQWKHQRTTDPHLVTCPHYMAERPVDWDQETCCVVDDCVAPATHSRLVGMIGEDAVTEAVCCRHASTGRPSPRASHLLVADADLLENWGRAVRNAFGGKVPYLVGSCLTRPDYRDVDVRLMLPDDDVAALDRIVNRRALGVAFSLWGRDATGGLPIDFQVQSVSEGNDSQHKSRRHALGIREASA